MPQDMNVLRCYSCKMFQVHMTKKAKKWQCKVCGAKQSFIKIYFQGTAKECRINVQHLNATENVNSSHSYNEEEKNEFSINKYSLQDYDQEEAFSNPHTGNRMDVCQSIKNVEMVKTNELTSKPDKCNVSDSIFSNILDDDDDDDDYDDEAFENSKSTHKISDSLSSNDKYVTSQQMPYKSEYFIKDNEFNEQEEHVNSNMSMSKSNESHSKHAVLKASIFESNDYDDLDVLLDF